jgi:RNA polymerase sigma-B factor
VTAADATPAAGGLVFEDLDVAAVGYVERAAGLAPGDRGRLRDDLVRQCLPFAGRIGARSPRTP